jgi:hypothetical protein
MYQVCALKYGERETTACNDLEVAARFKPLEAGIIQIA